MAEKPKTTKEIAQRIDPGYFRKTHRLRRLRRRLTLGLCAAGALWVAGSLALGRETVFANGPVSPRHRFIEAECAQCHTERFGPVHDGACLQCHVAGPHLPPGSARMEPECASCHREHGGDTLVRAVNDGHCNACHEAHRSIQSLATHIQFERKAKDQFLSFDHAAHLKPDLVGGPLACGACHEPQAQSRDFKPVRFDAHCAECHRERVAPELDDVVPHGLQPPELLDWIASVYVRRSFTAALHRGESPVPGRGEAAPDWTRDLEARILASRDALLQPGRGCLLCHVRDGEEIRAPEVPSNWMPKARFDHRVHRFVEGCDRCHDMEGNTAATDVELPGVETCRECHGPRGARDSCATCHPYHPVEPLAWR